MQCDSCKEDKPDIWLTGKRLDTKVCTQCLHRISPFILESMKMRGLIEFSAGRWRIKDPERIDMMYQRLKEKGVKHPLTSAIMLEILARYSGLSDESLYNKMGVIITLFFREYGSPVS